MILFGSRARGDTTADSDVDLVVVEAAPFGAGRDRRVEATRLWRALADFGVSKDILVYSSDEVEYWRDSLNHVLARALTDQSAAKAGPLYSVLMIGTITRAMPSQCVLMRGNEHNTIIRAMKPRLGSASLAETSWVT